MNVKTKKIVAVFISLSIGLLCSYFLNYYNHDATNDFKNFFYPAARHWVSGTSRLYDENSRVFFNAPWHMVLLAPFTAFTEDAAYILHTFASQVALIAAAIYWAQQIRPRRWVVIAGLLNLSTFALLYAGQMDTARLGGLTLAYWALQKRRPLVLSVGLALLLLKPQNVALPLASFLYSVRSWTALDKLKSLSVPVGLTVLFTALIGVDWPLRYVENLRIEGPVGGPERTIWGIAARINLPTVVPLMVSIAAVAWYISLMVNRLERKEPLFMLCLALATNLFVSPYVHLHHYVVLIIPLFYLSTVSTLLAIVALIGLWTPLLNLIKPDPLVSGVLYQVTLYLALLAITLGATHRQRPVRREPAG